MISERKADVYSNHITDNIYGKEGKDLNDPRVEKNEGIIEPLLTADSHCCSILYKLQMKNSVQLDSKNSNHYKKHPAQPSSKNSNHYKILLWQYLYTNMK